MRVVLSVLVGLCLMGWMPSGFAAPIQVPQEATAQELAHIWSERHSVSGEDRLVLVFDLLSHMACTNEWATILLEDLVMEEALPSGGVHGKVFYAFYLRVKELPGQLIVLAQYAQARLQLDDLNSISGFQSQPGNAVRLSLGETVRWRGFLSSNVVPGIRAREKVELAQEQKAVVQQITFKALQYRFRRLAMVSESGEEESKESEDSEKW